jgi:sugar phosphate permease
MFGLTFLNYAVLHATRSVWSAATKDFLDIYSEAFSKEDIADINMTFLACYGLGSFFCG